METPPPPPGSPPFITFTDSEHEDIDLALLLRMGFSMQQIAEMDHYVRALVLAFDQRAVYLRDKRFARMIVSEISQLFRKK
ncbi:MAG: hypothetical protein OXE95_07940 [Chloroflexi bacterium]|nr:hypothetical protein [Chloroflexota bacterium]